MTRDVPNDHASGVLLELPRSPYAPVFRLQEVLRAKRERGEIPDVVILLEHEPCITVGRGGGYAHLLAGREELRRHGISVHDTTRGGDITYHGPGQLVCYPILELTGARRDLHAHARNMEEVMIRTLAAFGITAGRKARYPGVWVGERKIGAMGIAVRKWITMHGIALNVCPDLAHFSFIVPCGIATHGVTSMAEVLGRPVWVDTVKNEMRRQFPEVFGIPLTPVTLEQLVKEEDHAAAEMAGSAGPQGG